MFSIFDFIPPQYYSRVFNGLIMVLCIITAFYYSFDQNHTKINRQISLILALALASITILFLGPRPVHASFTDTGYYIYSYYHSYDHFMPIDFNEEWLWYNISCFIKMMNFSDMGYLTSLMFLYVSFMFVACWIVMRDGMWIAILFCFSSFSFVAYGVNGMTNGIAASFALAGIAIMATKKTNLDIAIGLLLMLMSVSTHRAMTLPVLCALLGCWYVKNPKYALYFWLLSIPLSLVAGNAITGFFVNLGFDDRMAEYANLPADELGYEVVNSNGGRFRWDFIFYSVIPIFFIWYLTVKRNFKDYTFNVLAVTYILANAFWIMVIRSEQSNRFAYLSWFIYPLVIAYPLLRFKIWEKQDRALAAILLLYSGFTFFMCFIYNA